MGATSAMIFCSMGAAYGTAKSALGMVSTGIIKPNLIMKAIIPAIMAGIRAIYGLVVAVLITAKIKPDMTPRNSFQLLGGGLAVGLSGLAAGIAIGVVGDTGVRAMGQQPRLFVGMILILVFAEVLGIYGLIVALILVTQN
eukprot:Em0022g603a